MSAGSLEALALRAVDGDRAAMAALLRGIEGSVSALALRMLWNREDAEDATQDILVRVVTRLAQFDFNSQLMTWVYRIATNYLLDVKKSCAERQRPNFTTFAAELAEVPSAAGPDEHERSVLTEEVKIGCTLGMLQCLDRPHRLAYVLGEIFDLPAPEAAAAVGLEPAAFRKRLQRAREAIEAFTRAHCGLVSTSASCRCNRRVPEAIRLGRVDADALHFANAGVSFDEAQAFVARVEETKQVVELHRSSRPHASSRDVAQLVISALQSATPTA